MALTLNGSNNTIGGLAVGGVPDGTIDTDAIAASAITAAKRGTDSILQIKIHQLTGTISQINSNTNTWVDTGLTKDITPAATGNPILLIAHLCHGCDCYTNAGHLVQYGFNRGGSVISHHRQSAWTDVTRVPGTIMFYDSGHSSTSSLTYKLQFRRHSAYAGTANAFVHGSEQDNAMLMLIELKG